MSIIIIYNNFVPFTFNFNFQTIFEALYTHNISKKFCFRKENPVLLYYHYSVIVESTFSIDLMIMYIDTLEI